MGLFYYSAFVVRFWQTSDS